MEDQNVEKAIKQFMADPKRVLEDEEEEEDLRAYTPGARGAGHLPSYSRYPSHVPASQYPTQQQAAQQQYLASYMAQQQAAAQQQYLASYMVQQQLQQQYLGGGQQQTSYHVDPVHQQRVAQQQLLQQQYLSNYPAHQQAAAQQQYLGYAAQQQPQQQYLSSAGGQPQLYYHMPNPHHQPK